MYDWFCYFVKIVDVLFCKLLEYRWRGEGYVFTCAIYGPCVGLREIINWFPFALLQTLVLGKVEKSDLVKKYKNKNKQTDG